MRIYRFFYALLFLGIGVQFMTSEHAQVIGKSLLADNPDTATFFGLPLVMYGAVLLVTFIFFISGAALGRVDIDLIYGRVRARLDVLVEEMKALRD